MLQGAFSRARYRVNKPGFVIVKPMFQPVYAGSSILMLFCTHLRHVSGT
jgi:hypothetical protein